jgi:hypothetical protein
MSPQITSASADYDIIALITRNPKEDRDTLHKYSIKNRSRKRILQTGLNPPPFRELYLAEDRDIVIYKTLVNFFSAANEVFWEKLQKDGKNLIRKTAGIQALFRVLKELLPEQLKTNDLQKSTWKTVLEKDGALDFSNITLFESSGRGRKRIQDAILVSIGKMSLSDISDTDFQTYLQKLINQETTNHA